MDLCLPEGCYRLLVFDSNGDGMSAVYQGGYLLKTPDGTAIINNWDSGIYQDLSAIDATYAPFGKFCLPLGNVKMAKEYGRSKQMLFQLHHCM